MTIEEILQLEPQLIVGEISKQKKAKNIDAFRKQYDVKGHKVFDEAHRPKKIVKVTDTNTGETRTEARDVNRIGLPFQKIIVSRAAAFLVGEGIRLVTHPNPEDQNETLLDEYIRDSWKDNKLDYRTRKIARLLFSETEVAELWYIAENTKQKQKDKLRLRMQILSNKEGDVLTPHFNEYGDMDAFMHSYKLGTGAEISDIYTANQKNTITKKDGKTTIEAKANLFGKIPVVYYSQDKPEWDDVQGIIERLETLISNFGDSNDYFGSPLVAVKGEVTGFADKGEQGKMVTLEEGASIEYVTWQHAPESVKAEIEKLQEFIYSMTQTPDVSFTSMKGLGNLSGIAIRLMFLDAQLKSMLHQETFSEGVQRRLNIMLAGIGVINTKLKSVSNAYEVAPEFEFYMPDNMEEMIRTLSTATGNRAIMSRKTAVKYNPFVDNVEQEMEDITSDDAGDFGNILP